MEQDNSFGIAVAAQLQVLDEIVSALVIAHPQPGPLLEQIELSLARLKSVAGTRAALSPPDQGQSALVLKVHEKADLWLQFARAHLS